MNKKIAYTLLAVVLTLCLPSSVVAQATYLNIDNMSVSVGAGTSPGTFNNTFSGGQTIDKVIDAPSADAEEFHNQTTHIWFTATQIGGGLELDFEFESSFDITTVHFWNFTSEGFDVDDIAFAFFNSANSQVGEISLQPDLGSSPGIRAQDIPLAAPLNVKFVTAFLSGSNREVDFQNIGFSATPSAIPVPAAMWMLLSGLGALTAFRRRPRGSI